MSTLRQLSYEALNGVTISLSDPRSYTGTVFNEGETAFIDGEITNHTGLTLRNVVVTIQASGAIINEPFMFKGIPLFDGEESWEELAPDESRSFYVQVKATRSGTGTLDGDVSAEVVPFASRSRAYRSFTIHPD